jgi:tRNA pseudouridine55 synthase
MAERNPTLPTATPAARTPTTDALRDASAHAAPDGLLLVDKPAGITSHDVVSLVRRAAKTRRVGHAGTLDPFATGLLVTLIGRGTRLIPYIDGEPKVYDATIRFGTETETDDQTGAVIRESANVPDDVLLAESIARLTGEIDQVPPAYSAKQVDGTRAYDAARRGTPLTLAPKRVTVHRWEVLDRAGVDLRVRITCGGGTYIRALARDLGRISDSAAHLAALRRMSAGPFSVESACSVDEIRDGRFTVRPLRDAIPSLRTQRVDGALLARVLHGNPISANVVEEGDGSRRVALLDDEETLIAIAERDGDVLQPKLVLREA